jgi:hypothetical protein
MAIKANGGVIVENDFQLRAINGFDASVVTRMSEAVQSEAHTFTVFNSSGTAIKTIYFVAP